MEGFNPERHTVLAEGGYVEKEAKFISDFVKPEYIQKKAEIIDGIRPFADPDKIMEQEEIVSSLRERDKANLLEALNENSELKEAFDNSCDYLANYFSEVINELLKSQKEILPIFTHAVEVLNGKNPEQVFELIDGLWTVGSYGPYSQFHAYYGIIDPATEMRSLLHNQNEGDSNGLQMSVEKLKEKCSRELSELKFLLEQPDSVWF